jgi:hexokinase
VGTLVAHAYSNPRARIGFIYATGCNAAYPEKVSNIGKWDEAQRSMFKPDDNMLINTEIDIFGDDTYLPRNKYDHQLDKNHTQPDFQPWEKMMSGAYLGELTRLVGMDFIQQGALFGGVVPAGWDVPWSFQTAMMSTIERDNTASRDESVRILESVYSFSTRPTKDDIQAITRICRIVATRGAIMVAIAIASMIEKQQLHIIDSNEIVIGMNGSTYEYYPYMDVRVKKALRTWFGSEVSDRILLEIARDGGSIGGALIAMLAAE